MRETEESKLKHLLLVFSLGLLFSNPSFAQSDLKTSDINSLKGSVFEGTFNVIGLEGAVRIAFLPNTSPQGDLQYFHKIKSSRRILKIIANQDKACPFTPRKLQLQPSANQESLVGTISIFTCATSEFEELNFESDPNREPKATVVVNDFKLSSDKQSIQINATILGLTVRYQMVRRPMSAEILNSREALRSWVESLP